MPSVEELLNSDEQDEQIETYAEENEELVIDAETRVINIPESEVLFGVKGDKVVRTNDDGYIKTLDMETEQDIK